MNHKQISWLKSGIRIAGYIMLPMDLGLGAFILVLSEVVGIWEEVGQ